MAISKLNVSKRLQVVYDYGVIDGKQATKTGGYSLETDATDQAIFDSANTISELCEKDIVDYRVTTTDLIREE